MDGSGLNDSRPNDNGMKEGRQVQPPQQVQTQQGNAPAGDRSSDALSGEARQGYQPLRYQPLYADPRQTSKPADQATGGTSGTSAPTTKNRALSAQNAAAAHSTVPASKTATAQPLPYANQPPEGAVSPPRSARPAYASAVKPPSDAAAGAPDPEEDRRRSSALKRMRNGALALLAASLLFGGLSIGLSTSHSVDTGDQAVDAQTSMVSTSLAPGTVLFEADDEANTSGFERDYTVDTSTTSQQTTKLYIWDYAAEDGDYVQVYVDGEAISDPFMILNTPRTFDVPSTSQVTVVGTRDGGGGITYAVYCEVNGTTYFNGMNVGGDNVYTLTQNPEGQPQ